MKRLICMAVALCGIAHAEFKTGNKLLGELQNVNGDFVHGLGYVLGVYDTTQHVLHCPPTGIIAGQVGDIVRNYLEANPQERHLTGDRLVITALRNVWPCPERRRGAPL